MAALEDDLNTPDAVAQLQDIVDGKDRDKADMAWSWELTSARQVLGLTLTPARAEILARP
jgi:hypothetical protein